MNTATQTAVNWQIDIAAAARPRPDEAVGGDMMFTKVNETDVYIVCMDVLGHGPKAYQVAQLSLSGLEKMVAQFEPAQFEPEKILLQLDQLLAGGRGAAVAVAHIDLLQGQLSCAGVGNIAVRRIFRQPTSLISKDGVVGGNMRKPNEQRIALEDDDIYLLHTDGIQSRFSHRDYPQIISDSATTAVAHVLRHFSKQHDDAGCIIFKARRLR